MRHRLPINVILAGVLALACAVQAGGRPQITCPGEERDPWLAEWRARFLRHDGLAQWAMERLGAPSGCQSEVTATFDEAKFGTLEFSFEDGSRLTVETSPPETSRVALTLARGFEDEKQGRGLLASYAEGLGVEIDLSGSPEYQPDENGVVTYWSDDCGINAGASLVYDEDRLIGIRLSMAL